jgi:NAD(P) transhydrogenase subunit beta
MLHQLPEFFIGIADLAAAFLLLYGLHRMASPVTAPSGILVAGIGMAVTILASFLGAFGVTGAAQHLLPENIGLGHRLINRIQIRADASFTRAI